ncbi:MAG: sugar ABC transporter ATP-binding protein [Mesorhizobium sp.]|nr:MAG: sugar ABC transporter ATP-binding protein [Mesorhizobium sp.]RWB94026.1 MAG: sugar ABC transporter ATP-binding protein [Mesorhizobium sp.]
MNAPTAALKVSDIAKTYGATRALAGVSMTVKPGSIHALLGGNGSGKSTLIRILAGVERADAGQIDIGGAQFAAHSFNAGLAQKNEVHVVHQHSSTFPHLSVAENLSLGRGYEASIGGRILWPTVRERARRVLARFGIGASPDQLLSSLRPAMQTMVAIARALQDQEGSATGLLILDEPTATLSSAEVARLADALRRYAAAGQTIIVVTHRLDEVLDLADHVTVLRDGKVAGDLPREEVTHETLVQLIAGNSLPVSENRGQRRLAGRVLLQASGLCVGPLANMDITLRAGEVVGIAGLVGSGRTSLLRALFGLSRVSAGTMLFDGAAYGPADPADAVRHGIAYVPEDRLAEGTFPGLSVVRNVSMANLDRYWKIARLRTKAENRDAAAVADLVGLRPRRTDLAINQLSGGNQQKVVIGRWLLRKPRLLLLDEPTQGVDVGARADIHRLVRGAVSEGASAVVVSSDFSELAELCDRVVVLNRGRVIADVTADELTSDNLQQLAHMRIAA